MVWFGAAPKSLDEADQLEDLATASRMEPTIHHSYTATREALISGVSCAERTERTNPSVVAPNPARPRLPLRVQGQKI